MSFPPFGVPFSGIQFAAKFGGHDNQTPVGAFTSPSGINNGGSASGTASSSTDNHVQRYQTNGVHFNQNAPNLSVNNSMQYGQNISIPYSQSQSDLNFLNAAAVSVDQKVKIHPKIERDREEVLNQQILQNVNQSWQSLAGSTVDYSSPLLSAMPLSIQQFLKYSETIKKETSGIVGAQINSGNLAALDGTGSFNIKNGTNLASLALSGMPGLTTSNHLNGSLHNSGGGGLLGMEHTHMANMHDGHNAAMSSNEAAARGNAAGGAGGIVGDGNTGVVNGIVANVSSTATNNSGATGTGTGGATTTKKAKKKKPPKEKKPRPKPGEIRVIRALDGSTLYCCPECQMANPLRSQIEQHVISHAVDRRFVCDICNAALKRKDHLTRHKLSHIPDRPHVCNICAKSFKRKEQLTLHIVIHSGEKKHICDECGKGFYRKDHLRKHNRSHIARRVKCEVSAQNAGSGSGNNSNGQNNTLQGS